MYKSYKHLYNTGRWKHLSREYLRQNPICVFCGSMATVTDHIKPHRGDEALFFSWLNFQSLCKHCHDSTKAKIERGNKNVIRNKKAGDDGLPIEGSDHPWASK